MKFFTKRKKHKYINGTKGIISIFLCLIMTPILTLASALIEFSRYQNTETIFQEVMDCSSLSTLANYDAYLQKRFGLFAISQECNIGETYKNSISENSNVMEGMTIGESVSAEGILPLSDTDVLKRQILDFSESTVLTEVILEDLQLGELIKQLDKLMAIEGLLKVLVDTNTMNQKIKKMVKTGEELVEFLEQLIIKIQSLQGKVNEALSLIADLYAKLIEDEFTIDTTSEESEKKSYEYLVSNYLDDIKKIHEKEEEVNDAVEVVTQELVHIPDKIVQLNNDFTEAQKAIEKVLDDIDAMSGEEKTSSTGETKDATVQLYEELLNEITNVLEDVTEDLSDTIIATFAAAIDEHLEQIERGLGLDGSKRWNAGYYDLPLSDSAKDTLEKLLSELSVAKEISNDDETNRHDAIVSMLKEKYVPDAFYWSISDIKTDVNDIIEQAKVSFLGGLKESLGNLLTNLINVITSLFDLDVFYDGKLNAYLNEETLATLAYDSGNNNPYVSLLEALASIISAVQSFNEAIENWNFFAVLDGVTNLYNALESTVRAIVELANGTIRKINQLVTYVTTEDWEAFGELLLMSGYLVHNLPNRTLVGDNDIEIDTSLAIKTKLKGETLTGFSYSEIVTPQKVVSGGVTGETDDSEESNQSATSAILELVAFLDFLGDTQTGGTDQMFRGAELEYILAGTPSELMNQVVVFFEIYFLRLLIDLVPIFTDISVAKMAAAATIASWVVYLLEVFAEPLCDTILLVNGSENVYFVKKSCYLTAKGIPVLVNDLSEVLINNKTVRQSAVNKVNAALTGKFDKYTDATATFTKGILKMDYATHCMLLLMFTTTEENMLGRMANIVQLETNYYYEQKESQQSFDIAKAYTGLSATVDVEFDSFIKIFQSNSQSALIKKQFSRTNTY